MSGVTEIVPDFDSGTINCRGCGREISLYYNGGELDERRCCGYEYRTEATGFQLVIEKLDTLPISHIASD